MLSFSFVIKAAMETGDNILLQHLDLGDEEIIKILKKAEPNLSDQELELEILRYRLIAASEKENQLQEELKSRNVSAHGVERLSSINQQLKEISTKKDQIKQQINLLTLPIQQQLPDIFEEKRLVPNSFLRGALFGIVKKGKRAIVKDAKIFSMSHYDISFSGEYLDQNDLELWDSLIYLAKNKRIDYELKITLYELRKFIGYSQTQTAYEAIITRAKRLKFAMVEIKNDKVGYFGSLIDEVLIDKEDDGKLLIRFNKKLVTLFSDKDYTIISQDIRKRIGDNQLARWLYNFYESHKDPIPFEIGLIKNLCRSEANIYKFRSMLKEALAIVKNGYIATGRAFEYSIRDDKLYITKTNSKGQLGLFK